jgi:hypothetical protein
MIRTGIGIFLFLLFPVGLCAQTVPCTTEVLFQFGNQGRDRIFADHGNLYNRNNAKNFGLALLGGAVLANTKVDENFQNWHSNHVRSNFTNEFSKVSKQFGEGQYFIPAMAASALTYRFFQDWRGVPKCWLGEFTDRTFRGYLVGAPALLVFQPLLGASRPCDSEGTSRWRPFHDNNSVSGHAFIGAMPFITAAHMTDKPSLKGLFYALSACCAYSRVNDDAHYLSQVLLGWYLAYLSVRAVSTTEANSSLPRGLTIFPVCGNNAVGVGLHYQF